MIPRKIFLFCTTILTGMVVFPAYAIYLESTIYDMPYDKSFISKRIYNDSKKQNIYSISAVQIDKPGPGGENRSSIPDGELLFTPLNFSLAPGSGEVFKIFYRGPEDETERYYRIIFREMPLTLIADRKHGKESEATPAISIDTILAVRPRKINLKFVIDEKYKVLKNTGNTFFKVIIHKGCHSTDDEATIIYLLPGETWKNKNLSAENKKFIVALNKYTPIGEGCIQDK